MLQHLIILTIVIPMAAGLVALLFTGWRSAQRGIGLGALVLNAAATLAIAAGVFCDGGAAILVSQMGNWPAPFGISIVVDGLSAIMLAVCSVVTLGVFIYCIGQLPGNQKGGFFHPLYHLLVMGVQWSFVTGDLFNLFVAFEIMLMASYALLVVGTSTQQMRQAYKYVILNLFASMMFVTCCGLIYGHTGTLNMADLTRMSHAGLLPSASTPAFVMLLFAFGLKTAIFPVWFWLPDTYPTVHAGIGALFSGLLTKVGAYVLVRTFVMILGNPDGPIASAVQPLILASAGVTMFLGVLGAVSMHSIRRILSIHIISQVGYMILGVGLGVGVGIATESRELAVAGAIFFIIHNMVVKSALFLCGGLMQRHAGSDDLEQIGGLLSRAPLLGLLFFIAAMSLAGLPPLSGFFGKFLLIRETLATGHWTLATLALATSLLTLLSMLKIWSYGFWSPPRGLHVEEPQKRPRTALGMAGAALLVCVALSMGLGAPLYFHGCLGAARTLVTPDAYVQAVLGPARSVPPLPAVAVADARPHDLQSDKSGER